MAVSFLYVGGGFGLQSSDRDRSGATGKPFESIVNPIDICYYAGTFHFSIEQVRVGRILDTHMQKIKTHPSQ
jgi:hypothetical protein